MDAENSQGLVCQFPHRFLSIIDGIAEKYSKSGELTDSLVYDLNSGLFILEDSDPDEVDSPIESEKCETGDLLQDVLCQSATSKFSRDYIVVDTVEKNLNLNSPSAKKLRPRKLDMSKSLAKANGVQIDVDSFWEDFALDSQDANNHSSPNKACTYTRKKNSTAKAGHKTTESDRIVTSSVRKKSRAAECFEVDVTPPKKRSCRKLDMDTETRPAINGERDEKLAMDCFVRITALDDKVTPKKVHTRELEKNANRVGSEAGSKAKILSDEQEDRLNLLVCKSVPGLSTFPAWYAQYKSSCMQ